MQFQSWTAQPGRGKAGRGVCSPTSGVTKQPAGRVHSRHQKYAARSQDLIEEFNPSPPQGAGDVSEGRKDRRLCFLGAEGEERRLLAWLAETFGPPQDRSDTSRHPRTSALPQDPSANLQIPHATLRSPLPPQDPNSTSRPPKPPGDPHTNLSTLMSPQDSTPGSGHLEVPTPPPDSRTTSRPQHNLGPPIPLRLLLRLELRSAPGCSSCERP